MNTASAEIFARPDMSIGRKTLSRPPSSTPHASMNTAKPQRPSNNSQITAGIHTNAAPPTGSIESRAASTPNTTGEGRLAILKPTPTRIPA